MKLSSLSLPGSAIALKAAASSSASSRRNFAWSTGAQHAFSRRLGFIDMNKY